MTRQFKTFAWIHAIAAGIMFIGAANVQAQARSNPNLLRGNSLTKPAPRPVNVRAPIVGNSNAFNPGVNRINYVNPTYYAPNPYSSYVGPYQNAYPGIYNGYTPNGVNPYGPNPYQSIPYGFNPYGYYPGY